MSTHVVQNIINDNMLTQQSQWVLADTHLLVSIAPAEHTGGKGYL